MSDVKERIITHSSDKIVWTIYEDWKLMNLYVRGFSLKMISLFFNDERTERACSTRIKRLIERNQKPYIITKENDEMLLFLAEKYNKRWNKVAFTLGMSKEGCIKRYRILAKSKAKLSVRFFSDKTFPTLCRTPKMLGYDSKKL